MKDGCERAVANSGQNPGDTILHYLIQIRHLQYDTTCADSRLLQNQQSSYGTFMCTSASSVLRQGLKKGGVQRLGKMQLGVQGCRVTRGKMILALLTQRVIVLLTRSFDSPRRHAKLVSLFLSMDETSSNRSAAECTRAPKPGHFRR